MVHGVTRVGSLGDDDERRDWRTFERFDDVMGVLDRSMIIVTTAGADGERSGCLVGFSTQCSIDPGRFLVCLSRTNHTFAVAQQAELLAVHAVPEEHEELAVLFGHETGDEVDKFSRCEWRPGPSGVPLLNDCPCWFVGRILERIDVGDHVVHILEPVAAGVDDDTADPAVVSLADVRDLDAGHEP